MSDFIGEFYHTVDTKGRVIIPQKFREQLGSLFYISKGLDGCLWISPEEEWKDFREKLRELPTIDKASRQFKRFFTSGATECEVDKQGRVLIPQPLRNYAGIEKEAVLVGTDNRIEVWGRDNWMDQSDLSSEKMDEIAMHLSNVGVNI